jgi:mycothiol synthase
MPLPDGYILRHPAEADLPAAQAVLDAAESHDTGEPRSHEHELATEWQDLGCRPATDWWVVSAPAGTVVGVAWVWPDTAGEVTADHYVHPEHRGLGLGDVLLDAIETRVAELPPRRADGVPRHLVVWSEDSDAVRRAALDARGFAPVRQYYEMSIALDGELPPAFWPTGIEARTFKQGVDERRVWEADVEAFAEHFLFQQRGFEEWRLHHLEAPECDPALWWLAWDGDDLAGFIIPFEGEHGAEIGDLAVRKPWRGRGIARALLATAFATLRERGQTIVRLYVDAQNVTNAIGVYEAAGMRVARRFDVMQKPLT